MSALLTGASGQVGWEIMLQANQRGLTLSSFTREQLDITDPRAIGEKMGSLKPSIVINAAAYTAVDRAEQPPFHGLCI